MDILVALKQEESKLLKHLSGIRGAIAALTGAHKRGAKSSASSGKSTRRKRRVVSAALRAKLSKMAKERWARIRAEKSKGKKAK